MSILINMEMPRFCGECPCFDEDYFCGLTKAWKWKDEFDEGKERMSDCPLIEIPPHGDLIDRDELLMHGFQPPEFSVCPVDICHENVAVDAYKRGWNDAIDAIVQNEPTVIEAEGREHE